MVFFGLESEEYDRVYSDVELYKRIAPYLKKNSKYMTLVIVFLTISSVANGLIPFLTSQVVNQLEIENSNRTLFLLIVLSLLMNLTSWFFNFIQQYFSAKVIGEVVYDLQKEVSNAVLNQNLAFFDKISVGKIVSRVNSDTKNFGEMATLFMQSISSFFVVIIIFIPMFRMSAFLSIILLLMIPVVFVITYSYRKIARRKTLLGRQALAVVNAFVQETMTGIQVSKTFRQEDKLYEQFKVINEQSYKVNLQRGMVLNLIFSTLSLVQGIILAILIYNGGQLTLNGTLSAGDFYLFVQSLWALFFPLFSVASFWPQFQSGLAAAERIFALIDAPHSVKQTGDKEYTIKNGEIEFKNLNFEYYNNQKIFDEFSLKIKPGESIAIVGHTGAGKSTLAKLIGRFYEFQSGEILIDNVNIRNLKLSHYRKQIGFIPQTPFLWAETLENNVKFSCPTATREEVINALNLAGGKDWINDLPNGIETNVNERGKSLSMGQRQLVAFARVLLENPKILILDEATSSVDPFTEIRIQDALESTMKGRTSIIIAHRLWTVRRVDRIVVLDKGRIIEEGSHDDLMLKEGHYASLYNTYFKHQSFEFIEEIGKIR
jgi:ATP-binding cassette, subfamily B, bacterial